METVMIRVTKQVREVLGTMAHPGETTDTILRRVLGMPEADHSAALVRSLGEWPFKALEVKEHVVIPWPINPDTQLGDPKKIEKLRRAVWRHGKATGKLFHMAGDPTGLRVTRIK